MKKNILLAFLMLVFALILSACGSDAPAESLPAPNPITINIYPESSSPSNDPIIQPKITNEWRAQNFSPPSTTSIAINTGDHRLGIKWLTPSTPPDDEGEGIVINIIKVIGKGFELRIYVIEPDESGSLVEYRATTSIIPYEMIEEDITITGLPDGCQYSGPPLIGYPNEGHEEGRKRNITKEVTCIN